MIFKSLLCYSFTRDIDGDNIFDINHDFMIILIFNSLPLSNLEDYSESCLKYQFKSLRSFLREWFLYSKLLMFKNISWEIFVWKARFPMICTCSRKDID